MNTSISQFENFEILTEKILLDLYMVGYKKSDLKKLKNLVNNNQIGGLVVSPIEQGKGVGKILMEEIESHFPGATVFEVFTGHKSQKNLAIYQKLGYTLTKVLKLNEKVILKFLQKHNHPLSQTGVNNAPPGQLNC